MVIQSLEVTIRIEGLAARARSGEKEAFAQLYQEYFEPVYRYIYLRVGQVEQAEDLTQDVFLKALDGIGSYHFRGVPFGSWLFRIAHNLIIDHYRRAKNESMRLTESLASAGDDDPVAAAERSQAALTLKAAVEMLPPQQREVISLRFGAQMSIAETARATGKTEGSVKKLQFEALAKLRNMVGRG